MIAKGTLCSLHAHEQRTLKKSHQEQTVIRTWRSCSLVWLVKPPLISALAELYCYQDSSSCIQGSTLCRMFPAAAQIWPMSDYGQNAAKQSSLTFVCIALSSSLLLMFLFRRGRYSRVFLNMQLAFYNVFFSLALSSSGFPPSFLSFIKCCSFALQLFSIYPVFVIEFLSSYHSQSSIIMPL